MMCMNGEAIPLVGKTWLNEGDIWKTRRNRRFQKKEKIGSEISKADIAKNWLDNNKLDYQPLQRSPNKSANLFQILETSRIKKFEKPIW